MASTTVDVAQLVEPRVVIPAVVGSSPIVHPIFAATGRGQAASVRIRAPAVEPRDPPQDILRSARAISSIGRAADS